MEERKLRCIERNKKEGYASGDLMKNKTERKSFARTSKAKIPSKLKAQLRFAYEESAKKKLGAAKVDGWTKDVMTHVKAHYRHPSLGTQIEFEVRKIFMII